MEAESIRPDSDEAWSYGPQEAAANLAGRNSATARAFGAWHKPDEAIRPGGTVMAVDRDSASRTTPFGRLRAITPRLSKEEPSYGR
jgi:hypothetical protein